MTPFMTLIERVECAKKGSRELDFAILASTNPYKDGAYCNWRAAASAFGWDTRVTTSVDAALALIERVLPRAEYKIDYARPHLHVELPLHRAGIAHRKDREVPLALTLALLKALDARETAGRAL